MNDRPSRPPDGSGGPDPAPWPPRRDPWTSPSPAEPAPRPARRAGGRVRDLLGEPPRQLAATAALLAAALTTVGALAVAVLVTSDFALPLAERLTRATTTVRTTVPLLLAVALALADPGPVRGLGRRLVFPGALAVAMVAGALLVGRLLSDLLAGDLGGGERLGEVLVDLGALVVTAALGWWAARDLPPA